MNIVVVSAFRNMQGRVSRYFDQVRSLQLHARKSETNSTKHNIRVVAIEGDSTDKTLIELQQFKKAYYNVLDIEIVNHNHGQRIFSSTEDIDRLSALTGVMKAAMKGVKGKGSYHRRLDIDNLGNPFNDDVVLYVESDLVWQSHQVGSLIDMAYRRESDFDIFAPLIFAGENFYDIWAYRHLNGSRFTPNEYKSLPVNSLIEIASAGSCLAFNSELAELVNPIGEDGLVSWCNGARSIGYRIAVATEFRVDHPQ